MSATVGLSRRTMRVRTAFQLTLGAAVILALGLLIVVAVQNRNTGEAIRGCTTPGNPCFDKAASRQAQVIGEPRAPINNVAVVAAACGAAHPGDITATRECVEKGLKR